MDFLNCLLFYFVVNKYFCVAYVSHPYQQVGFPPLSQKNPDSPSPSSGRLGGGGGKSSENTMRRGKKGEEGGR